MTTTVSYNGRLGNQIIRNLAVSLIAEKHNLTLGSALKYYQMADKEYIICGTEWNTTYAKNKKLLIDNITKK